MFEFEIELGFYCTHSSICNLNIKNYNYHIFNSVEKRNTSACKYPEPPWPNEQIRFNHELKETNMSYKFHVLTASKISVTSKTKVR